MKKSLIKNTFREIWNSKARFISIMAIIALGCGFYCGIKATAPSMEAMANKYYNESNLMDYRLVSTVGFDKDDVKAIKNLDKVTSVEAGYFADVITNYNNSAHEVRLISQSKNMNKLTLVEGRLPKKKGEVVVENGNFTSKNQKLGDTITINEKAGDIDLSETLATFKFKIVGVVRSPMYISYERGTTTVGDGSLDTFMYVDEKSFSSERYTEMYVKTIYSKGDTINDTYTKNIDKFQSTLKSIGKTRAHTFKVENIDKAQNTLNDKKQEYKDKKASAQTKLANAKKKITDGEKNYNTKIADAENQIAESEAKIKDGYSQYYSSKNLYYSKISTAEAKIAKGEKDYNAGLKKYNAGKKKYDSGLKTYNSNKKKYDTQYNTYIKTTKPNLEKQLSSLQSQLTSLNSYLDSIDKQLETETSEDKIKELEASKQLLTPKKTALTEGIAKIKSGMKSGEAKLASAKAKLDSAKAKLDNAKSKLTSAKTKLDSGKAKLDAGKKTLATQKTQGYAKLQNALSQLKSGESKLADAKAQLETSKTEGKAKLDSAKAKYEKAKTKTTKELKKAEQKLNKAQKKIDNVSNPKWYTFTRQDNPGYSGFKDNTGRVDAVSSVFPVFFLLVAVLVCLTTMTRLVDEKRTEIGTFKALGYSNTSIVLKFAIYSTLAGVVGAVVGILIGVNTLPYIIYNAYKIMYYMNDITIVTDNTSIIINLIVSILCTTVITAITCYKSLSKRPAKLMRPKGPKSGKRILLEHITPLWKRFSFTSKVTARNLFRYKSRMLMTVLGVAGCTALIVSAFGLKDSLNEIASIQFYDVYNFNAVVVADGGASNKDINALNTKISKNKMVSSNALVDTETCKATNNNTKISKINLVVPKSVKAYSKVVNLRTRVGHNKLKIADDGVIISEKLSKKLNVKVGDSININVNDTEKSLKVNGISEQYVQHYIFISPKLYEKNFGKAEFSTIYIHLKDYNKNQSIFGKEILKDDTVAAVSFMKNSIDEFNDMLSSMNMVVFIMIFCAGALAFVVLYNLTNINIAERVRELATIKVLGFNNRETSQFIYRENLILVIIGIVAGLLMGTFLAQWIITTVELDTVMFGRNILWTSYLLAALLTSAFALIVNFIMYFKMKNINMVESLKSVE